MISHSQTSRTARQIRDATVIRLLAFVIALAATATIIATPLLAGAAPVKTQASRAARVTFNAKFTSFAAPDPSFPQPGDTEVGELQNTRNGHRIGLDRTACVVINHAGAEQCLTTVGLPGGTLQVAYASSVTPTNITAPITAGTGRYAAARGYFTLHQTSPGTFRVTLHLS